MSATQTTVDDYLPPSDDPDHPDTRRDYEGRDAETVYVEEIRIDGTTQTALDVGGKVPGSAVVSFSGKATVMGSLRKGDVLTGEFRAVVRSAASKDVVDKKTGIVTEAEEKFSAQIIDIVLD